MRVVFADTSYYIALLQRFDQFYQRAGDVTAALRGRTVTTAWVLGELASYLSAVPSRASLVSLVTTLRTSPYVSIIRAHHRYFDAGLESYSMRSDKAWSLVDCISLLVMEQHGIREAISSDHHFQQAGFNALLI